MSRLLAALDNSPKSKSSLISQASGTPLKRKATETEYAEAGGSSQKKRALLEQARLKQTLLMPMAAAGIIEDGDRHFLGSGTATGAGGFALRWDAATPVRSIDVGGVDQQQKLAEFVSKAIDDLGESISTKDANKKLGLKDSADLLPGMEVRLLPHQAIGVAWMIGKENSPTKGGILADDMGLGKTVQMIATMVMRQPDPEIPDEQRTTLIVVPAALLQQWKDEILEKTNDIFTVHVHHGKDKLKKISEVCRKDVIITTYQTLNLDYAIPKNVEPEDEAEWLVNNGGVLARTRFYRVVADEAQFIRNRATRSSVSIVHVRARFRWMLTGTPITNTLADIYGLLRFGRFRPWNDWNDFNEYICKMQTEDAPLAAIRAQTILNPILLRRNKNSKLEDGTPVLKLKKKTIDIVTLEFSQDERDVYNSFEKKTKIRLNKFIKAGTLVKNHAAVLVMILRLRQLCCHPHLILSQTDGFEDPTMLVAANADKEMARAAKAMGKDWVAEVKKAFLLRAAEYGDEAPDVSCPVCKDVFVNDSGRVLACKHEVCFDCILEMSAAPIVHDGQFGHGDERGNAAAEKEYEAASLKGHRPCPECKKMADLALSKVFKSSAFEPSDEEFTKHMRYKRNTRKKVKAADSDEDIHNSGSDSDSGFKKKQKKAPLTKETFDSFTLDDSDDELPEMDIFASRPSKAKAKEEKMPWEDDDVVMKDGTNGEASDSDIEFVPSPQKSSRKVSLSGKQKKQVEDREPTEAVYKIWRRGDDNLEPSAKMLSLVNFIQDAEESGDKTICYSQWTTMLDLIEKVFSRYGIQSLRYDGKMDRQARDRTLTTFKKLGGPRVILISTKCGGVGLNLVSANRVVNMDLSWNYAAESQAYDRVHRMGQTKEVFVHRLVVRDTIEERMLALQDVKVGLAEAALGEGTGGKLHKLSVKDIKLLFGMTKKLDPPAGGAPPPPSP